MSDTSVTMNKNRIQQRLRNVISASGLSNSEIARRCNVSRGSVGKWLKSGNISKESLLLLCETLNIELSDILNTSDSLLDLAPLQLKVIQLTKELPKEHYYKLEDIVRILEDDSE